MDPLTRKNRTYERFHASRVVGLGECRGPQQKGPGVRRSISAPDVAGSRIIDAGRQRKPLTTAPADPVAAYVDRMDRRTRARQYPVTTRRQCEGNCHAPGSDRTNSLESFRDSRPVGTSNRNTMTDNPALTAHIERMERVQAIPSPEAPQYDPSQASFMAFQMAGNGLRKTRIIEHRGQDFRSYATPWEQKFSSLTYGGRKVYSGQFRVATPVVDESLLVVAHIITVTASWCWVPMSEFKGHTVHINPYLAEGIPVYVDNKPMDGWARVGTSDNMRTLLVAIDGEVLQVQASNDLANIEVYDGWMLDVLQLGAGVVTGLGRAAIKRSVNAVRRRTGKKSITKLTGRTKQKAGRVAGRVVRPRVGSSGFIKETGMPRDHFWAVVQTAREQRVMAIVRNTNNASTPHIARKCAAKPLEIKANTDQFGVVNVGQNAAYARAAVKEGYYIVHADGVARQALPGVKLGGPGAKVPELKLDGAFWTVRPGQVITTGPPGPSVQPLVGDYDLMDVFPMTSTGSNVSLHSVAGKTASDITGPYVTQLRAVANLRFDRPRIMHGAQGQFGGYKGGATVFYPDGRTLFLRTEKDVKEFYDQIGRKTAVETYNPDVNSAAHKAARAEGIRSGKIVDMNAWRRAQTSKAK